jgi:hypothetical protein
MAPKPRMLCNDVKSSLATSPWKCKWHLRCRIIRHTCSLDPVLRIQTMCYYEYVPAVCHNLWLPTLRMQDAAMLTFRTPLESEVVVVYPSGEMA